MLNLFRLCRKDEISFDIVAKNGSKGSNFVEATCDFDNVPGMYGDLCAHGRRYIRVLGTESAVTSHAGRITKVQTAHLLTLESAQNAVNGHMKAHRHFVTNAHVKAIKIM